MSLLSISELRRNARAFAHPNGGERAALWSIWGITDADNDQTGIAGVGAASAATVVAVERGDDETIRKTVLTLTAASASMTDIGGTGLYGGVKIYDFPLGLIQIVAATVAGNVTAFAAVADTFTSVTALGTVVAASGNITLTTTEADIMASVANATAAADIAAVLATSTTAAVPLNGTVTAADAYLNFGITDAGSPGNGAALFTGTVTIFWRNLTAL